MTNRNGNRDDPASVPGSLAKHLRHLLRVRLKYARRPRRYRQLLREVCTMRPVSILEVGVHNAVRAVEMIEAATLGRSAADVSYFGFDLFEDMTPEIMGSEFSKWPPNREQIQVKLGRTGARIELFKGFTKETLPGFVDLRDGRPIDLAFIDGGHAVETIRSDWQNVERLLGPRSVALFDDYYHGNNAIIERFGCNKVINELDPARFEAHVLPDVDKFEHDGERIDISIVRIRRRS